MGSLENKEAWEVLKIRGEANARGREVKYRLASCRVIHTAYLWGLGSGWEGSQQIEWRESVKEVGGFTPGCEVNTVMYIHLKSLTRTRREYCLLL